MDDEGIGVYGELALENWSNRPIRVTDIEADVRGGELEIVDIRVLDGSREVPLFDVLAGRAEHLFPDSTPIEDFVFEPLGDWQPDGRRQLGDELVISFRNLSVEEDLYVYGFRVRYEIDGQHMELVLDGHAFVSCLSTTPEDQCGVSELEDWGNEN